MPECACLVYLKRGIDFFNHNIGFRCVLLLVLHQCDQGANNDDGAVKKQRRQLISERLAGTGRKNADNILGGKNGLENFPLPGSKSLNAETSSRLRKGLLQTHAA